MRMTVDAMKKVAKDILVIQRYVICRNRKRADKTVDDEVAIDFAKDDFEGLASAFVMLGLVSRNECDAIAKFSPKKADIDIIKKSPEWMCASSKTDNMPFDVASAFIQTK